MTTSAPKRMVELHQSLLKQSFDDVKTLWGYHSRSITSYAEIFHDQLPLHGDQTDHTHLIQQLALANIILFGDFHTFHHSQETFLSVIRDFKKFFPEKKFAIALEMNRVVDQNAIDAFLQNQIDEAEFLRKTSYQKYWGFPWESFRAIFDFAKMNNLRIIGINAKHGGETELHERDRVAAQSICQFIQDHTDHQIFALVGEYHLAPSHLPREILNIEPSLLITRILNNTDRFANIDGFNPLAPTYLKVDHNSFCIMNAPSWLKWQSLQVWKNDDHAKTDFHDDEFDLDYHFYKITKTLNDFFELSLSDENLKKFRIAPISPSSERSIFQSSIEERRVKLDGFSFIGNRLMLSQFDHEFVNEAAGQFLNLAGINHAKGDQQDQAFYLRVFQHAAGVFAAKLLNPQRNIQCIHAMQAHLRDINQHHLKGHAKHRRHGHREAIRHQDWLQRRLTIHHGKFGKAPSVVYLTDEHLNYEISRCVGQITGLHLFHLYIHNHFSHRDIGQILFHFPDHDIGALWQKLSVIFSKDSPQAFLDAA